MGLLEDDDLFRRTFLDMCAEFSSNKRKWHYFAMLLYHLRPSMPEAVFDECLDELFPPFPQTDPNVVPVPREKRRVDVLCALEYYLIGMGTSTKLVCFLSYTLINLDVKFLRELGIFGLPTDYNFAQYEKKFGDEAFEEEFFAGAKKGVRSQKIAVDFIKRLNADQRKAFDEISNALTGESEQRLFFVEGAGGCGMYLLIFC